jgi:iron complex outermembrane recepter protein
MSAASARVRHRAATVFGAVLAWAGCSSAFAQAPPAPDLTELSLEELGEIEVTSFSRRPEPLADTPASLYVITADDIRRSGATSLAEALRLAPNLQIAQVDAGQYAISARGFNNLVANKLLVLVDGRTIYTPLFSGVFWDQQDVLLEDVERIEIISGPRAAMWGANAVNGVINVITRAAGDTRGALVSVAGGNRRQVVGLRYGGGAGTRGHFRVYGKATRADANQRRDGTSLLDGRHWLQGGFRADWRAGRDGFTVQGDAYRVESEHRGTVLGFDLGRVELTGTNLLARWTRQVSDRSDLRVQAYFDKARRRDAVLFQPDATLFDFDVQHGITLGEHRLTWGGGYRHGSDQVDDGILVGFRPTSRSLDWVNAFGQGELHLTETTDLTLGAKLERNGYTGWEFLPGVRLAHKPAHGHLVWGAVSRAVRAPARLDRDVIAPFGANIVGGPDFVSEVANIYQLGYRARPWRWLTGSLTAFRHDWDRLRSGTAPPVIIENRIEGPVDGVEAWLSWQPRRAWRLSAGGTALRKRLRLEAGSTDPVGVQNPNLANDPTRQWLLRSSLTLGGRHEIDAMVRHVTELPNPAVPAYTAVDARYGWRLRDDLELAVAGQNLFDARHSEFNPAQNGELERAVLVSLRFAR